MTNAERLTAAGWHSWWDGVTHRWRIGDEWMSEDEAIVVVLTAERDAAIARAERAEADALEARAAVVLCAEFHQEREEAILARAEAAEALAASMLDVSPEDAHDVFIHGVELSAHYDDAEDMGALVRIRAALRAHAAKVSR